MKILQWILLGLTLTSPGTGGVNAEEDAATEVIVLGVAHSAMLVAESYQPAVFRAYIERAEPDAICVERPPEEFARGSHYEFTYEIQDLVVPFARGKGIVLCPFDWIPAAEDQFLAFGIDLDNLPFVRSAQTYANFVTYPDAAALSRDLFYAETEAQRKEHRDWYQTVPGKPRFDFPRRLFLYRTFLQAMRVAAAARQHKGGRVLVIVGAMHKDDIEQVLKDERGIRVVSPTQIGQPVPADIAGHVRPEDLASIATFNLLGAQASTENVDWNWLRRVVQRLQTDRPGAETRLSILVLGCSQVNWGQPKPSSGTKRSRLTRLPRSFYLDRRARSPTHRFVCRSVCKSNGSATSGA